MGGYEIAGNLRLKAEEVTIGGSNFSIGGSKYFSVTEDELEDFPPPAVTKRGPLRLDSKGRVIEWRNQSESGDDLHVSCESKAPVFVDEIFDYGVDEDGNIDVRTVGEILFGDGSGRPVRGIMTAMVESGAFAEKFPPGRRNRAARRAERKKAKGRPEQRVKLGHRISELRFAAAKSQIDLAREAGISRAMMSAVENGKYLPTLVSAKSLAKALGTTVDGLIDGIIE